MGLDVFGHGPGKRAMECICPNCGRNMAASRFAPHLEKCMGMGRNSSRIASRRYNLNMFILIIHPFEKYIPLDVEICFITVVCNICRYLRLKTLCARILFPCTCIKSSGVGCQAYIRKFMAYS